jgi:SAM-dependent methyltransferase
MTEVETKAPKSVQRWSADDYARSGSFVPALARPALDLLAPRPGMRVLDLGCGDGVLTLEIKERGADVLAADLSDELLAAASAKGLEVRKVDGHALPFDHEFDAVFTNAALHWMRRPELVIAGVRRALKPRGRFVGEFGGHGNVAAIATAIRAVGERRGGDPDKACPWFFPSVAEYRRLLEQGGFAVTSIMLIPRPTELDVGIEGWLRTFGRSFFDQFEGGEKDDVLAETVALLRPSLCDADGIWTADYVRLRFAAELKD